MAFVTCCEAKGGRWIIQRTNVEASSPRTHKLELTTTDEGIFARFGIASRTLTQEFLVDTQGRSLELFKIAQSV